MIPLKKIFLFILFIFSCNFIYAEEDSKILKSRKGIHEPQKRVLKNKDLKQDKKNNNLSLSIAYSVRTPQYEINKRRNPEANPLIDSSNNGEISELEGSYPGFLGFYLTYKDFRVGLSWKTNRGLDAFASGYFYSFEYTKDQILIGAIFERTKGFIPRDKLDITDEEKREDIKSNSQSVYGQYAFSNNYSMKNPLFGKQNETLFSFLVMGALTHMSYGSSSGLFNDSHEQIEGMNVNNFTSYILTPMVGFGLKLKSYFSMYSIWNIFVGPNLQYNNTTYSDDNKSTSFINGYSLYVDTVLGYSFKNFFTNMHIKGLWHYIFPDDNYLIVFNSVDMIFSVGMTF